MNCMIAKTIIAVRSKQHATPTNINRYKVQLIPESSDCVVAVEDGVILCIGDGELESCEGGVSQDSIRDRTLLLASRTLVGISVSPGKKEKIEALYNKIEISKLDEHT